VHASLGVGVIGLGFMGRTHVAAYESARRAGYPCRLVAVCDRQAERRAGQVAVAGNIATLDTPRAKPASPGDARREAARGVSRATGAARLFDPSQVCVYADAADLLADPAVQLVSICTPTDTHVDLTIAALRAGKHVLVEKPLALGSADAHRVVEAAAAAQTLCMPAMCMRFWPGWPWLKAAIDAQTYGRVESAVFTRLGSPPAWSAFYQDVQRCGGGMVDMHIHDTDFIRWCFGDPQSVASTGTEQHITTIYRYPSGPPHVVAEGGWIDGLKFRMRYRVAFERAVAEFEFGREHPLMLTRNGTSDPVLLESLSAYDFEIRYILDAIARGERNLRATVADAEAVARLLESEHESLLTGVPITL
jgi:predicted dehydrogenase